MTYAELVTQIQQSLENYETSFVDLIPSFVKQAEERIHLDAQLPASRSNKTTSTTATNRYLAQPTDFIAPYEASVISGTTYSPLILVDVGYIREAFQDATATGLPTHYALFNDSTFLLGPTPDQNYSVELHYFRLPESIVTANTTWLGDNVPSALLYGALIEGYVYAKGEVDMLQVYDRRYKEAIDLVKTISSGRSRSDTYRDGQFKTPVQK
jgi:hypothetical protein